MLSSFGKVIVRVLQYLVVLLVWPYSRLLPLFRRKRIVPPPTHPLLFHSATELAKMIRNKEVTSVEVLEAYIERIKAVEPALNCVVDERFDAALKEAHLVDELIRNSNHGPEHWATNSPLLGVPLTVKESIGVTGMSNNAGRPVPKENLAKEDAVAVVNLRKAGAIPLLVSNTPELCLFWETFNSVKGITNNPFDTRRAAGGSSGGECSLIGAGASVIGIGSDIVGSGRIPALFCGTYGHKPTPGIISVKGHMPMSEDKEWDTFLTLSPLCRYAEDLPLLMSAAAPEASKVLRLDEPVDVKKLRIFYMEEHNCILTSSVDREVKDAIRRAVEHLKKVCLIKPQKVDFGEFDDSLEAVSTLFLRMKSPQTIFQRSSDVEDWTFWDVCSVLMKRIFGCSKHTMHAIFYGAIKKIAESLSKEREMESRSFKHQWQRKFQQLLGDEGVMILPTFPSVARYHYQLYYKMTDSSYVSSFNLLEMASTAIPMGLTKSGLPVGVQLVACKNQDRLNFAVAKELGSAFGGWVPPGVRKGSISHT